MKKLPMNLQVLVRLEVGGSVTVIFAVRVEARVEAMVAMPSECSASENTSSKTTNQRIVALL